MRNCSAFLPLLMTFLFNVKCSPISQPGYENPQYVQQQNIPSLTYKPQAIHFKPAAQPARPIYEGRQDGLQQYSSQQKSPPSIQTAGHGPVRQVFVPTNQGQRQVDSLFYDQVLKAQQQAAARRAQTETSQQQTGQQTAYQPQQVRYVQQQQYQQQQQQQPQYSAKYQKQSPLQQRIAQQKQQEEQEQEEDGDYDPNPSYQFGFDVKDDQFTNYQTRKEEKDGKKITGSYSVVDADGYIRTVKYTADPIEGFKAEVSREPTDIKIKIPKPVAQYQAIPRQSQQQQQAARQNPQYNQVQQRRNPQPQRAPDEENAVYRYQ